MQDYPGTKSTYPIHDQDAPLTVGSVSILVLEDDHMIAMFMLDYLECFGLDADIAKSVSQAKEMLARNTYTLAFCDVNLPDGSGISIHEEALERGIESYLMSAKERPLGVQEEEFLYKPELYNRLLEVCSNHVNARKSHPAIPQ